jgi:exopolysaccharide/PEP-CTERM locus tyrosine autokinase
MDDDNRNKASHPEMSGASLVERAAREIERRTGDGAQARAERERPDAATKTHRPRPQAPPTEPHTRSPVAAIDREKLKAFGALTPDDLRSELAEEMRLVKRTLIRRMFESTRPHTNLVQVTSAWPGEGKSFMAVNLAISLASEMDYNVLLIDADVHRSAILKVLGIKTENGILDVLRDPEMDVSEVIVRTDMERLSVIGPGHNDALSTERLSSQRMSAVTTELAERYNDRIIIFDTSPLLATSEPGVMAQLMGQVIIVVEADRTTRQAIDQALEQLPEDCPAGMVLNKSKGLVGGSALPYYGYYGYYNSK